MKVAMVFHRELKATKEPQRSTWTLQLRDSTGKKMITFTELVQSFCVESAGGRGYCNGFSYFQGSNCSNHDGLSPFCKTTLISIKSYCFGASYWH